MKKWIVVGTIVGAVALVGTLAWNAVAFAQGPLGNFALGPGGGPGFGRGGGQFMNGPAGFAGNLEEPVIEATIRMTSWTWWYNIHI